MNWKEAKAMVAIVALTVISIACICTSTDGLITTLLVGAIAAIGGYELAKRKQVEE